jgi:hypothetical protein
MEIGGVPETIVPAEAVVGYEPMPSGRGKDMGMGTELLIVGGVVLVAALLVGGMAYHDKRRCKKTAQLEKLKKEEAERARREAYRLPKTMV